MIYSLVNDGKICQVCKKSFPNGSGLRGHMMSHTKKLKGKRNLNVDVADSTGTQSPLTAVEEAGLCLVAMSKGERPAKTQNWNAIDRYLAGEEEYLQTDSDSDSNDEDDDYDDDKEVKYKSVAELLTSNAETLTEDSNEDEDNDTDETYLVAREQKCKKQYICNICGKVLGSFQALGGHRSSHKCKRLKIFDKNDQHRGYECNVCGRIFESGQALGGDKKAHYI